MDGASPARAGTDPQPAEPHRTGTDPQHADAMPRTGTGEMPRSGTGEIPRSGTGEVPRSGTGEVPRSGTGEVPRSGTGDPPRSGTGDVAAAAAPPKDEFRSPDVSGSGSPPASQPAVAHPVGKAAAEALAAAPELSEMKEELSRLSPRYDLGGVLGVGAYGLVLKAADKEHGEDVAVKRVHKSVLDDKELLLRILREVRLLAHFTCPSILSLRDLVLEPQETGKVCGGMYMVLEQMDTDMKKLLRGKQALQIAMVTRIFYQMLIGLKHIHAAGAVHRDMCPGNILVRLKTCEVKIADLGIARELPGQAGGKMTEYVTNRWYRAPEVLMCAAYTQTVDVWGAGCIFGELIGSGSRGPLFPGKERLDQLQRIFAVTGSPPHSLIRRNDVVGGSAKQWAAGLIPMPTANNINFPRTCKCVNEQSTDLLYKMLVLDPVQRLSIAAALAHPFLADERDEADEDTSGVRKFELDATALHAGTACDISDEIYRFQRRLTEQKEEERKKAAAAAGS